MDFPLISIGTYMPNAPRDALQSFRDEELLADVIAGLIGDARHVAIGASSPIPAAAALLARERGHGRPYVSLLGSRRHSFRWRTRTLRLRRPGPHRRVLPLRRTNRRQGQHQPGRHRRLRAPGSA